ncbi:hypothetical protein DFH07DRAFT_953246 [Mycena maculata]|uniref:Nephrocystin 3-like N-terminal domain-containing protein n=1 Tax=Mycena maculata TaxID=230809 RepID=A0AAD7JU81_9AGAR|nr:hypothetical protein DFH07DRAFT_953246 [Mycena maculata]
MLWNKKEAKEYLDQFERAKSLLNVWLSVGVWDATQQQRKKQENDHADQRLDHHLLGPGIRPDILTSVTIAASDQRNYHDKAKREKILDWISGLNFLERQADIFKALQERGNGSSRIEPSMSGNLILGNFCGVVECMRPTLYLILSSDSKGPAAGAGKTVLASLVVDHLQARVQNDNSGVMCIFLNHKETGTQTLPNLIGSLWKQLILGKPIPSTMHDLYEKHRERHTRPSEDELVAVLHTAVAEYSRAYVIVDAADEYPEDRRHLLLEYLAKMGPTVNVLITSRKLHDPTLISNLTFRTSMQILKTPRLSKHVERRPELREEIETTIINNTQGMFLLTKLHIGSLTTQKTV